MTVPSQLERTGRGAQRLWSVGLLLALLAGCVLLKSGMRVEYGWGTDGQYYLQLAEHVRDGDGLVSRVSLYHQGFQSWPHRVNQAPLWPLALGLAARLAPLEVVARRLPETLVLLDLVLVYLLGNRLWRRIAGERPLVVGATGVPDFGHVAVVLFGCNPVLLRFSSAPYSESLAFGLLFGALIAVDLAQERWSRGWAFAAGALAALGLLARAQLLALPVAVLGVLAFAALRSGRGWRLVALAGAGFAAVFAPWLAYLASWVPQLTPTVVLGLATQPETPGLATYQFWVPTDGWREYLLDRGEGLAIAFTPGHRWSYFHSHGAAVALVPLALLLAAIRLVRRRARLADWLTPERAVVWAALLAGAGMLAPIHHAHSKLLFDWLFSHRHGLPFVLLLLPAAATLLASRSGWLRGLAAVLIAVGAIGGLHDARSEVRLSPISDWDRELGNWLDRHERPPVVITTGPSALALVSHRANFHWTDCDETPQSTAALLDEAGADYVVVYPWEVECPFLADAAARLEPAREFGGGKILVLRKRHGTPPTIR